MVAFLRPSEWLPSGLDLIGMPGSDGPRRPSTFGTLMLWGGSCILFGLVPLADRQVGKRWRKASWMGFCQAAWYPKLCYEPGSRVG